MSLNLSAVVCPVCSQQVPELSINEHLDNSCSNVGSSKNALAGTVPALGSGPQKTKAVPTSLAPIFNVKHKRTESSSENSIHTQVSTMKKRVAGESAMGQGPTKRKKLANIHAAAPLAEKLRPRTLAEFVGQPHLTGAGSLLMISLESGSSGSYIFWGPPGSGKTTLARLMAKKTNAVFKELSATVAGINDVRAVFEEAKATLSLTGRTFLFLDEVHRFNKAQQDIFLPFVEQGHIQLIGATTENPSFKLTAALLSRCRVFVLERLTDDDIKTILKNAVERLSASTVINASGSTEIATTDSEPDISAYQPSVSQESSQSLNVSFPQLTPRVISSITSLSTGDARTAISLLELVASSPADSDESTLLESLRRSVSTSYDRTGESHYDMISALHKSVRGSQGNAAMYWLARMLTAGEDPLYIARRMVVCASEDIGLADNHALTLAMATLQACQVVGMPECRINLAHLVAYLAEAPKSTRAYEAYKRAEEAAKLDLAIPVPLPMRNAPTELMKELGYANGYCYNPEFAHPVHNDYLPIQFRRDVFLREAGDMTGKVWDEDALRRWENEENGGKAWDGRITMGP